MSKAYSTKTCCKINLGLNITQRRPDGYHNLQTIFYPVPLYDELTIKPLPDLPQNGSEADDVLTLGGNPLEGEVRDNLVLRAVRLLRSEGFPVPPLCIDLKKVIPSGAGLGGGSSDAACMVKSISEMFGLNMTEELMKTLVARLGADCPFFVNPRPLFAEGIGDVFTPISLNLNGWYLMLVKPEVFVSTREAYAGVHPHTPAYSLLDTAKLPVGQWEGRMVNDFEESIFANHPLLAQIKEELYRQGAAYASISGSGSTIFGLFRSHPNCEAFFSEHFTFVCQL
ncbi:MAG: 4-(cytidine 5'-diphospho)-2-C-methyl-D-erythritol kinase [Bacteroidaceae bacterium]|nr:4-(cytidine 5'-diphospho)-2-C-methyl-D-erythritol kinase [Bacteroidaceae bacterium]